MTEADSQFLKGDRSRWKVLLTKLLHYGVALLSVALALGINLKLSPYLDATPTPPFFAAVMVSAWYGGLGPGLLATAVSTVVINYFFVEPVYALSISNSATLVHHAQIQVKDNGKGISPEFLPYVFDYFRQEDSKTTRRFGGLGLGLAIVRHLTELHGGTIYVDSPGVEQGATFTIQLPLISSSVTINQDGEPSPQVFSLKDIKVLVVDDDQDAREFVAFLLEQELATVVMAASGNEALTILSLFQPNIILSDIGMPDMDGYMLMQKVRALTPEQGGLIQAIALTAYAGEYNQKQALKVGFQKHIAKPVEPDILIKAICEMIWA